MTDQELPETTVVVPVWDRYVALRFEDTLASLSGQEAPVAIIVVDNASREAVPEAPGATIIRSSERISLGAARNLGLAHVQTRNVMFADADDLMLPQTVAHLQAGLDADPRLVAFAMPFLDAATGLRHRWPRTWIATLVRFPRLLALINAVWAVYPITGPVLVRTEVARSVGGHADVDNGDARGLGAALLFRGRVGWSEQPGCVYHQRPGSNLDQYSGAGAILANAAIVRRRLRADRDAPAWVTLALPLIAAGQWLAVAAHLVLAAGRGRRRRAG